MEKHYLRRIACTDLNWIELHIHGHSRPFLELHVAMSVDTSVWPEAVAR
jgi:hypothetical protein